jgi:rhodanese-related sulfurtransferase
MKTLKTLVTLAVALILNLTIFAQQTSEQTDLISFEAFEAKLQKASPQPQIIDVRTEEEFRQIHIKGAKQVDIANKDAVKKLLLDLDKKKPVFVYSINNGRSITFVKLLKENQFQESYALPGGLAKWVGAGKPVESTTGTGLSLSDYKKQLVSDKLVLVEVVSKYCGGCAKLAPVVETVSNENPGKLKVVKVDLFENKQLGKDLNIQSVPTLILYKGGEIVWQKNGSISKETIENAIHQDYAARN